MERLSNLGGGNMPPSFFPTSKEVSGGIQWLRDHPMVATACAVAATAASVISVLRQENSQEEELFNWDQCHQDDVVMKSDNSSETDTEGGDYEITGCTCSSAHISQQCRNSSTNAKKGSLAKIDTNAQVLPVRSISSPELRNASCMDCGFQKDETSVVGSMSPDVQEFLEKQNVASPQWGWYVSTTPPEEFYPHKNMNSMS